MSLVIIYTKKGAQKPYCSYLFRAPYYYGALQADLGSVGGSKQSPSTLKGTVLTGRSLP